MIRKKNEGERERQTIKSRKEEKESEGKKERSKFEQSEFKGP